MAVDTMTQKFEYPPLKRHPSLRLFSRDHYVGLVQAQHLIKAAKQDAVTRRKVVAESVDAWDREIAGHFNDEERLLIDLMQEDDRQRLLQDHRELMNLARQLRDQRQQVDPDPSILTKAGEMLEEHIRWEERELFSRLQTQLQDEQLIQLQRQTEEIERKRPRNVCRHNSDTKTAS